ncbi:hypothetical protein V5O48_015651 [Marasmius crinis-equi]|uniref:Glycoside hydrolase family 76 protein n=1 Tax=Marasmius crinis-equi TaxID=585013 RepID=A0ABR3ETY5_9AGAR
MLVIFFYRAVFVTLHYKPGRRLAVKKPSINNTLDERITLAIGAINAGIAGLDSNGYFPAVYSTPDSYPQVAEVAPGNSALLFSQMAEFDLLTQRKEFKDAFASNIQNASHSGLNGTFLVRTVLQLLEYGYAAVRGFKAYNDSSFLDIARLMWDYGRAYTLNNDTGHNDIYPSAPVSQLDCARSADDLAGGTFLITYSKLTNGPPENAFLDGTSTAAFALLSASLAEATSNASYADAADQSILFIQNFMNMNDKATTTINATTCTILPHSGLLEIGPAGFLTEALVIMSLLPGSLQPRVGTPLDYEHRLSQIIQGAFAIVISRQDGIMTSFVDSGDAYLMRAFYQVYRRKPDLRANIKDFIGVQYNALIDLAKVPAKDVYSFKWIGPPPTDLLGIQGLNESMAATVLVGAIHFDDQDSNGTTPNTTPSSRPGTSRHDKVPVIAGATIGSVAFVTTAALLIWWTLRKRQRGSSSLNKFTVDAFLSTGPSPAPTARGKSSATVVSFTGQRGLEYQPSRTWLSIPRSRKARRMPEGSTDTAVNRASSGAQQPQVTDEVAGNRDQLTTEELVQMLNQRLQPGQWNEDEMPPDYISNQGGRSQSQSGDPRVERLSRHEEAGIQHSEWQNVYPEMQLTRDSEV